MRTQLICALAVAISAVALAGASADPSVGLDGITKPSGDVTLSFVRPGRVDKVLVKEGDLVKAGDLIAQQDDKEEAAQLKSDIADADDETELKAEMAVRDQDQLHYKQILTTPGVGAFERDDAEMKVTLDDARIRLATHKRETARIKVEATQAILDKMKLKSPIDGVVAETMLKAGEAADGQNMKVVRIVQLDPLWVEVSVPIQQARQLRKGDVAEVTFNRSDKKVRTGKVELVFPVGNSATTIKVRVSVANPEHLQPGENVGVKFGVSDVAAAQPKP